jgi:hypothetical protein
MKKILASKKRLRLATETVRHLREVELSEVGGGRGAVSGDPDGCGGASKVAQQCPGTTGP